MDLKSKRVVGIAQMLLCVGTLVLYTKIGGMGMICAAGSMEVFLLVTELFFAGLGDAMEQMTRNLERKGQKQAKRVQKASILYGVFAALAAEGILLCINRLWLENSGLTYVDKMLELLMFAVPLVAILQVMRGMIQMELDRTVIGISKLIFSVCMFIGTWISYFVLNAYGTKVAALMQSIKKWHFYVVVGLVPGVLLGTVGSILFLAVILWMRRDQISLFSEKKQSGPVLLLSLRLFPAQLSFGMVTWMKHLLMVVLLGCSITEITAENYLFGHFYGAVLPLHRLLASLLDTGLTSYKKRLYTAYRRRMTNVYYKDLKAVLCYIMLHGVLICVLTLALHKSYLAVWSLQTSDAFMELMTASAWIGLLYAPSVVLLELLKYRGLSGQRLLASSIGAISGIVAALICAKTVGAGTLMYVLSVGICCLMICLLAAVSLSVIVGIDYLSVLARCAAAIFATICIGAVVYVIQKVLFTALGGFVTCLIGVIAGWAAQFFIVVVLRVFDKEELTYFPLPFLTKRI